MIFSPPCDCSSRPYSVLHNTDCRLQTGDRRNTSYSLQSTAFSLQINPVDHSGGAIPVPIPNTEVKPSCANGTAEYVCGRVGRRRGFPFPERPQASGWDVGFPPLASNLPHYSRPPSPKPQKTGAGRRPQTLRVPFVSCVLLVVPCPGEPSPGNFGLSLPPA